MHREQEDHLIGYESIRMILLVVTLAALRWLADQNAAFVMLERDGSVLATSQMVLNTASSVSQP